MPINNSLMGSLEKKYGKKKGRGVYFGMESSGGKAFKKGVKTASDEGHTSKDFASYKRKRKKGRKK